MKFFRDSDERAYAKARRRLRKATIRQTATWAQTSLWTIQEGLEHFGDRAALEQARTGAVSLLAAIDTLLDSAD